MFASSRSAKMLASVQVAGTVADALAGKVSVPAVPVSAVSVSALSFLVQATTTSAAAINAVSLNVETSICRLPSQGQEKPLQARKLYYLRLFSHHALSSPPHRHAHPTLVPRIPNAPRRGQLRRDSARRRCRVCCPCRFCCDRST